MLATAIGIDRALKRDIRTVVAGDDRFRRVLEDLRLEGVELSEAFPAIVKCLVIVLFETPGGVRSRAAAPASLNVYDVFSGRWVMRFAG
jgi:hypothetical protein